MVLYIANATMLIEETLVEDIFLMYSGQASAGRTPRSFALFSR